MIVCFSFTTIINKTNPASSVDLLPLLNTSSYVAPPVFLSIFKSKCVLKAYTVSIEYTQYLCGLDLPDGFLLNVVCVCVSIHF